MNESQKAWVRLLLTPGLSVKDAKKLLIDFELPEKIFETSYVRLAASVGDGLAKKLHGPESAEMTEAIEKTLLWLKETPGARLITLEDPDYPLNFLKVPEPPVAFFAVGNLSLLNEVCVTFVGTTHPTEQTASTIRAWAAKLATTAGVSVIEGDVDGVERFALQGALKAGEKQTVWITPKGLGLEAIASRVAFVGDRGLVISATPPFETDDSELAWVRRQSLLIAASNAFLLPQASIRSRSLRLIREALDVGRDVMAIPGSIHHPLSKGPHSLIKQGAHLVEGVSDILQILCLKKL